MYGYVLSTTHMHTLATACQSRWSINELRLNVSNFSSKRNWANSPLLPVKLILTRGSALIVNWPAAQVSVVSDLVLVQQA